MRQAYGLLVQTMLYKRLVSREQRPHLLAGARQQNAGASGLPFVIYSDSYDHAQYITGLSAASLCGILWTPEVRQAATPEEWRARGTNRLFLAPRDAERVGLRKTCRGTMSASPTTCARPSACVCACCPTSIRRLPTITRFGIPPMRPAIVFVRQHRENARPETRSAVLDDVTNPYAQVTELEQDDQFMFGPSHPSRPLL